MSVRYLTIATLLAYSAAAIVYESRLYRVVSNPALPDDYITASFKLVEVKDVDKCAYICMKEKEKCEAVVFNETNGQCHLFNVVIGNVESMAVESTNNLTYVFIDEKTSEIAPEPTNQPEPETTAKMTSVSTPLTTAEMTTSGSMVVDCQGHYEHGVTADGKYTINIDQIGPTSVWCEFYMGRGWTVIQRRQDGSVDFNRDWEEYKNGFGDAMYTEYWLGNDAIHQLTKTNQKLNIYIETGDQMLVNATFDKCYILDEAENYKLIFQMGPDVYDKRALQFMALHKAEFSTKDRDNDERALIHCAQDFSGGWWFTGCAGVYLNGIYPTSGLSGGIFWVDIIPTDPHMRVVMRITHGLSINIADDD